MTGINEKSQRGAKPATEHAGRLFPSVECQCLPGQLRCRGHSALKAELGFEAVAGAMEALERDVIARAACLAMELGKTFEGPPPMRQLAMENMSVVANALLHGAWRSPEVSNAVARLRAAREKRERKEERREGHGRG